MCVHNLPWPPKLQPRQPAEYVQAWLTRSYWNPKTLGFGNCSHSFPDADSWTFCWTEWAGIWRELWSKFLPSLVTASGKQFAVKSSNDSIVLKLLEGVFLGVVWGLSVDMFVFGLCSRMAWSCIKSLLPMLYLKFHTSSIIIVICTCVYIFVFYLITSYHWLLKRPTGEWCVVSIIIVYKYKALKTNHHFRAYPFQGLLTSVDR